MYRKLLALLTAMLALAVTFLAPAGATSQVTYFKRHCKDAAHLKVVAAPTATLLQPADVNVIEQQATSTLECINDPTYRGPIYTFVIDGVDGLNMEPSGATFVMDVLGYYGYYHVSPELQHTDRKQFVVYADFSAAAATKVASELVALGL
jgi:hypothetical protein